MDSKEYTMIRVQKKNIELLKRIKVHPNQSYEEAIVNMIKTKDLKSKEENSITSVPKSLRSNSDYFKNYLNNTYDFFNKNILSKADLNSAEMQA